MTTIEKCFNLTAAFEGGGYAALSGNFDGQGLSAGFLQWNLGQGTLQPLLLAYWQANPKAFTMACTQYVDFYKRTMDLTQELLTVAHMDKASAVRWAIERQDKDHRLMAHWTKVFKALAGVPEFQGVQRRFASSYLERAKAYLRTYGFSSERGLALCFDICVQMGSILKGAHDRYAAAVKPGMTEQQKLEAMATAIAPQGGPWARDVLARKMTIAKGAGIVHGRPYQLERDFGITLGPVV